MSSIYAENRWCLKTHSNVSDPLEAQFPQHAVIASPEGYVPGEYVCLWGRAKTKDGSEKSIIMWLRKSIRRGASGDDIFVSEDLLREKGVDLKAYTFASGSSSTGALNVLKMTVIASSDWNYKRYWVLHTRAGRLEMAKLAVGLIVAISGTLLTVAGLSHVPEWLFPVIVISAINLCLQAIFAFFEKLGKPN